MSIPIRLVDYFVVVSNTTPLEVDGLCAKESGVFEVPFKSGVIDRYPLKDYDKECVIPINFPMFCFASGWKLKANARQPDFHPFVLTLVDGTHMYCATFTIYEKMDNSTFASIKSNPNIKVPTSTSAPYRPLSLCIISHWPLYSYFGFFLNQLYHLCTSGSPVPIERWVQQFVSGVPLPPPGKISVLYKMPSVSINIFRPTINSLPLADVPFELLFRALDLQNVVQLWSAVLLEFKVVLHSKHAALLGIVIECITALLYPFRWFHIYIPLLPLPLVQYVHCPCPYLIGINVADRSLVDIPSEAIVVDLDRNTISMPSPVPPSLPEKQRAKLHKKLKTIANVFEKSGSECDDQFDFGAYFLKRVPATGTGSGTGTGMGTGGQKGKGPPPFEEGGVRQAFLQVLVSLMKSYRKALDPCHVPANRESPFNLPSFLKHHPASSEEFLTHLCTQSQGFQQFISARVGPLSNNASSSSDTSDIVMFDELIIQKKNRSNHLSKDKHTPFLNDTSHNIVRTFEVPAVDTSGLDKDLYTYPSFPRLQEDLYSSNLKPAPQLVDKATGFRSRVPNKELAILWDIVNATAAKSPSRRKTINGKLFNRVSKDFSTLWSKKHLGKKYDHVMASIVIIQAYHKGKMKRTRFLAMRVACVPLQASIRGTGPRLTFCRMKTSAIAIQAQWRGFQQRSKYRCLLAGARCFQAHLRAWAARSAFLRAQKAALLIQALLRCASARSRFVTIVDASCALQSAFRKWHEWQSYHDQCAASVVLQNSIRTAQQASSYSEYRRKVILTQAVVRRHRVKKEIARSLASQFDDVRMRLLAAWSSHHVPKLYRAAFLLVYNSVTISHLFILLEEEKQFSSTPTGSPPPTTEKRYKEEQKYLYSLLREYAPEGGINQLYIKWGVDSTGKKRKHQFIDLLFAHPTNFQESKESAELLCKIANITSQCEEFDRKKMTHLEFDEFVASSHQKMIALANSKRGCVLL